jgi:iron-sulfur cluster assembly protein
MMQLIFCCAAGEMVVSLCRKTVAHFRHLLASTHHSSIFLGVRGGGCNGLKYVVAPTSDAPSRLDEELTLDGVHVIVCGKSLLHLLGTAVRWEEDAMGAGLRFDNPNASATCGCGETFS